MSFLKFNVAAKPAGRKTDVWVVRSEANDSYLGVIGWHAPWRRFCFFPVDGTIFDASCLEEMTSFIRARMAERK